MKELELYIHIPFCVQKCNYCDFLSAPAGRQVQNAYMETLLAEISGKAEKRTDPEVVSSIFIGGGTPSVVEAVWIEKVLAAVRSCFVLSDAAEISMELNPGTVTREAFTIYRRAGINRLSIGCQSMLDQELRLLGRIHTADQFLECYHWAREAGFENINVDLMSALPGQTLENWEENLQRVLSLDPVPEHVSAYSLILEENTPFYELWKKGKLREVDEDLERAMYWRTEDILSKAGYVHYEISNYAKSGFACRHNCGYWTRKDYLGFGLGAASLDGHVRYKNTENLQQYLETGGMGCQERQPLSEQDEMEETMFLGLRMLRGVELEKFANTFGIQAEKVYASQIEESRKEGLLTIRQGKWLGLTPRGIDVSNYVMAKFLF